MGMDQSVDDLTSGSRLGRFVILSQLGAGGMGAVYLAEDSKLGRRVALKVVGARAVMGDSNARLLREARAAASLEHPNAVAIYEVGEVDGRPYIVMEVVRDRSLRGVISPRTRGCTSGSRGSATWRASSRRRTGPASSTGTSSPRT